MSAPSMHPESEDPSSPSNGLAECGGPIGADPKWELIEVCVGVGQRLGMPRSVAEIFGFIFTSDAPVTFDQIVEGLSVSNGSVSHGLRYLRRIGAVEVSYQARDRRDFFQAQTELRSFVTGFLAESTFLQLRNIGERLQSLSEANGISDHPGRKILLERIGILQSWNDQARAAITAALETLR